MNVFYTTDLDPKGEAKPEATLQSLGNKTVRQLINELNDTTYEGLAQFVEDMKQTTTEFEPGQIVLVPMLQEM